MAAALYLKKVLMQNVLIFTVCQISILSDRDVERNYREMITMYKSGDKTELIKL